MLRSRCRGGWKSIVSLGYCILVYNWRLLPEVYQVTSDLLFLLANDTWLHLQMKIHDVGYNWSTLAYWCT